MKTMYTGDILTIDGSTAKVLTAEITEDNSQWLTVEIDGCIIPVILSNECQIPKDWQSVMPETYEEAAEIEWIPAEATID